MWTQYIKSIVVNIFVPQTEICTLKRIIYNSNKKHEFPENGFNKWGTTTLWRIQ